MIQELSNPDLASFVNRLASQLTEIFNALEVAHALVQSERSDHWQAKYLEAIEKSDAMNQKEISKYLRWHKRQASTTSPPPPSQLQRQEEILDLSRRIPAIARGNYALALIRHGKGELGADVLFQAAEIDSNIWRDQYFTKRLQLAVIAGARKNTTGTVVNATERFGCQIAAL